MQFIEVKLKEIVKEGGSGGFYRIIFESVDTIFTIPVVISGYDAQPLLLLMDGTSAVRPRTHDLFCNFISASGYAIRSINITRFERGVFHALAVFDNSERRLELDCRPSDAVALAIKCKARIFVSREIVESISSLGNRNDASQDMNSLKAKLTRLVELERYEEAALLRDRIEELKSGKR